MRCLALSFIFVTALAAAEPPADPLATLRPGHPRLLLNDAQLAEQITAAKTDPLRAQLHRHLLGVAEAQWQEPPIDYILVGPRLLDQSRKAISQVLTNAMAFRLTGDARYADFALQQMLRAAAFPDWNPSHFLDVAEMATALALGYDWLHARLSPAQRATIRQALLGKALVFARGAYARAEPTRESFPFVGNNLLNNWNQVCNGGFVLAALALAEDEPAMARLVLAGLRETLPFAMAAYAPDGAYPEGPMYWGYGTHYNVYLLAALESALGNDLGLGQAPGFDRTVLFRLQMGSPLNLSFNFADSRPPLAGDDVITWLGRRYGHPYVIALNRAWLADLLRDKPDAETSRFLALHAVWFPSETPHASPRPALDARFRGPSQVAVFRSAWDDPRALWAGFKAGSNAVNHGHLDLGAFMLDADGVRWAVDLGPDDYNLPGYWDGQDTRSPRWQYYRLNNFSHNTLTPAAHLQEPKANADIVAFVSTPARAFAIADLSRVYPGVAKDWRRGLAFLERSRVLVQDELSGVRAGTPLTWQMLTAAKIELAGAQRATLTQDGRTLTAQILSPANARFSTRPATPPTARENQNAGVTALVALVPPATSTADLRIVVLLSPQGEKWTQPNRPPDIEALADWK